MTTRTSIIILISFLVLIVTIISVATFRTSTPQTTTSTTTTTTKKTSTTKSTVSLSSREDLAEKAVLKAVLREMRSGGSAYLFKNYDVGATKYKIGKVENNGDRFTFYITFYLYDNYGNYKNKIQKTISVDVDEYGKVGYVGVSFAKWEFN